MKIEVLAFSTLSKIADLSGLKVWPESHGRISFVCSESRHTRIYNAVRESGNNPFAVMSWAPIKTNKKQS